MYWSIFNCEWGSFFEKFIGIEGVDFSVADLSGWLDGHVLSQLPVECYLFDIFLFLFNFFEPGMFEGVFQTDPFLRIGFQKLIDQVLGLFTDAIPAFALKTVVAVQSLHKDISHGQTVERQRARQPTLINNYMKYKMEPIAKLSLL